MSDVLSQPDTGVKPLAVLIRSFRLRSTENDRQSAPPSFLSPIINVAGNADVSGKLTMLGNPDTEHRAHAPYQPLNRVLMELVNGI
jgi:hypothetical protein